MAKHPLPNLSKKQKKEFQAKKGRKLFAIIWQRNLFSGLFTHGLVFVSFLFLLQTPFSLETAKCCNGSKDRDCHVSQFMEEKQQREVAAL